MTSYRRMGFPIFTRALPFKTAESKDRGKDAGYPAPRPQIPACAANPPGSCAGCVTTKRWLWRMRALGSHRSATGPKVARIIRSFWLRRRSVRSHSRLKSERKAAIARLCSAASSVLWRSQTSPARASSATALRAFPTRTVPSLGAAKREISRFPCGELPCVRGVYDLSYDRPGIRHGAPVRVAFPIVPHGRRLECISFRGPSPHGTLSTLRRHPRGCQRMTRGRFGSLVLRRKGLSPSTPRRSPGAWDSIFTSTRAPNELSKLSLFLRWTAA